MADSVLRSPEYPHFFQPLNPGFHSHLSIPLKFFSKHIEGLSERNTVTLRSDACEKTWKVKIEGRRLTDGWKEFAQAQNFRIQDIIIFRHEGDLMFHVTGFGRSCCEIQYVKDKTRNSSMEQNQKTEPKFSPDVSFFAAPITKKNLREDRRFLPLKFTRSDILKIESKKITITNDGVSRWTLDLSFRKSSGTFCMKGGWRQFCRDNGLKSGDSVTFSLERKNSSTPLLRFFTSESKSVVSRERGRTSKRKTGETRFVTLTASPASLRHCRLHLPLWFTRGNGMENIAGGKRMILLDKHEVEWPVNLAVETKNRRMHLGSGLTEFLEAIGVKANESFTLELVWEDATVRPMFKFCSKVNET